MTEPEIDPSSLPAYGESLKDIETHRILTGLNMMTAFRAVGGVALGVGMAVGAVGPGEAIVAGAVLGSSDMEQSVYRGTLRFPRLQKALRIVPSELGRLGDPIADKAFIISSFAGAVAGGLIPLSVAGPILATETVTAVTTGYVKLRSGEEPEVTMIGKGGFVARCFAGLLSLSAAAVESQPYHEALAAGAQGTALLAAGLGALSIRSIWRQRKAETEA